MNDDIAILIVVIGLLIITTLVFYFSIKKAFNMDEKEKQLQSERYHIYLLIATASAVFTIVCLILLSGGIYLYITQGG